MSEHSILIADKPFMNYVTAVVMQFTTDQAQEVVIKARGKYINRAVDVSEVVKTRFLTDAVKQKDVVLGSDTFENKEGKEVRVSTIEIVLERVDEN